MNTFDTQLADYFSYCEHIRNFTDQTMRSKRHILTRFAEEVGLCDVREVTNRDLDRWRLMLLQRGVSQRTINTRLAHVMAFYKYLMQQGKPVKLNPAMIYMARLNQERPTFYAPEDIHRALTKCQTSREVILISLAYEAGLRLTELVTLQVGDITGQRIDVLGKGRKLRAAYITDKTEWNLQVYLAECGIEDGYIFPTRCNRWGRPDTTRHMSVDQARNLMKAAFYRAGLKTFHPHALRHSFATTMLKNGADVTVVQNLMGHQDVRTTGRYIHWIDGELQKAHQRFMRPIQPSLT